MALRTYYLPGNVSTDNRRLYFVGATFSELPSSGLSIGDLGLDEATGVLWMASSSTQWSCPLAHAMSDVSMQNNATATVITTANTWTKVLGTTTLNSDVSEHFDLTSGLIELKLASPGDVQSTAIHVMTTLAKNDYVELAVSNESDADDLTVKHMNLFGFGICP